MTTTLVLGGDSRSTLQHARTLLGAQPALVVQPRAEGTPDLRFLRRPTGDVPKEWPVAQELDVTRTILRARQPVLVDNIPGWVAAQLTTAGAWGDRDRAAQIVDNAAHEFAALWNAAPYPAVALTDDLDVQGPGESPEARLLQEMVGRANGILAAVSTNVHWLVVGRVVDLSNAPLVR
ncbi:hypothetical protein G9U51_09315 [Calidifontibacter sp. DB0510]|uniref:Adenosylcobinamide-phosphate guanylyltransferase n=1 Tax=Metallococcus carri TaxID=1656884 RepID=A0A967B0C3_9MICO|nr:bifunctional adenosylcobinamide kinase/adenosylcobinamide-phosphate guanylyltransferase [Metallococcus carri]NHN55973.1 hypothetical protein [Metallococcus carri]NOP37570.1 hypothetical protein [Calidifontibacter sp. DB2511S]